MKPQAADLNPTQRMVLLSMQHERRRSYASGTWQLSIFAAWALGFAIGVWL